MPIIKNKAGDWCLRCVNDKNEDHDKGRMEPGGTMATGDPNLFDLPALDERNPTKMLPKQTTSVLAATCIVCGYVELYNRDPARKNVAEWYCNVGMSETLLVLPPRLAKTPGRQDPATYWLRLQPSEDSVQNPSMDISNTSAEQRLADLLSTLEERIRNIEELPPCGPLTEYGSEMRENILAMLVELRQRIVRPVATKHNQIEWLMAKYAFVHDQLGDPSAGIDGPAAGGSIVAMLRHLGRLHELPKVLGDYARYVAQEYPPEVR